MESYQQRTRRSPFISYTLILAGTILLERHFPVSSYWWPAGSALLAVGAIMVLNRQKTTFLRFRWLSVWYYVLVFSLSLLYLCALKQQPVSNPVSGRAVYTGTVTEVMSTRESRQKMMVNISACLNGDTLFPVSAPVLINCTDSMKAGCIGVGDRLTFKTRLYPITNSGNPGQFDYQRYMQLKGISWQGFINRDLLVQPEKSSSLRMKALRFREKLVKRYRLTGLKPDQLGVLAALTLGDRNFLTAEMKNSFSASGVMHVLAVSGLHVGIISVLLGRILGLIFRRRRGAVFKALLIVVSLWSYAFLSGLSPSVMRAATMFSFVEVGQVFRRKGQFFNSLFASAFFLLVIRPSMLFEVGFQLSYLAVASIVWFQPRLAALYTPRNRLLKWFWELLTVSLSAQLGTTPVSLLYFHQFPVFFWLTNLVVVPAAALILYLAITFFLVSAVPLAARGVGLLLKLSITGLIRVVEWIEHLPGSVIDGILISVPTTLMLYLLLLALTRVFTRRSVSGLKLTLILCIALLVQSGVQYFRYLGQQIVVVYNISQTPLFSYIHGRQHFYFSFSDEDQPYELQALKATSLIYRTRDPVKYLSQSGSFFPIRFHSPNLLTGDVLIRFSDDDLSRATVGSANLIVNRTKRTILISSCFGVRRGIYFPEKLENEAKNGYLHELKTDGAVVIKLNKVR